MPPIDWKASVFLSVFSFSFLNFCSCSFVCRWGCPPSKFPWTYDATETCYLVKGKVKVYPEGSSSHVEINAGDLAVLPKGLSCTWDVSVAIDKYYKFDH